MPADLRADASDKGFERRRTIRSHMEDSFPDLGPLSDAELKDLIQKLTEEEEKVSYTRRFLHGKIDILRADLVNRLRKKREEGEAVISGADVQQLTDILAGRALGEDMDPGRKEGNGA